MTWETLVGFIRKGAREAALDRARGRRRISSGGSRRRWKGLSREFGICYSCGTSIDPSASLCPQCNRLQEPPPNPDALLEASREGQMTFSTPPATIDGTVLASTNLPEQAAAPVAPPGACDATTG